MYATEERAGAERAGHLAASVRRVRGSATFALNGGWRLRAPVHACLSGKDQGALFPCKARARNR